MVCSLLFLQKKQRSLRAVFKGDFSELFHPYETKKEKLDAERQIYLKE